MKMKTRSFLAGTIALALTAFTGSAAMAADNTFQPDVGSSGDWNDPNDWTAGVPTAGQNVIVPSGKTCTLDTTNGVADSLDIDGDLFINGVSLTVDGTSDQSHDVSDTIDMDASGRLVFISHSPTLTGASGSILDGTLELDLGATRTLSLSTSTPACTSSIDVGAGAALNIINDTWSFAAMQNDGTINFDSTVSFSGNATNAGTLNVDAALTFNNDLVNDGIIDVAGTVTCNDVAVNNGLLDVAGVVDFNGAVTGSSSGEFKANAGEIEFSAASTSSLAGHFYVLSGGLLDIKDNVVTTGDLKQFSGSGSQIIVAPGKHFQTS
jgi:hypothetical protein